MRRIGLGLRGKLLGLLLAFGLLPLGAIGVGYVVSRDILTRQASRALESLTHAQAVHVATELDRQRLLLRTIAGQLQGANAVATVPPPELSRRLVQGLPEGGVFDGLRLVTDRGRILASVALRNTAPHWPPAAPAAAWSSESVVVHREDNRALAYLVAVVVTGLDPGPPVWLEGHVRAEDFRRILLGRDPLLAGATSAVFQLGGGLVLGGDTENAPELPRLLAGLSSAEGLAGGGRGGGREARIVGEGSASSLLAIAAVTGTPWGVAALMPVPIALASLPRLRNSVVAAAAGLLLLMLIVGAFAARSVTTPLRQVALAAQRYGREGSAQPIPVQRADELGIVVASFNAMAAERERSRRELERLHAAELERAQQLATVGELASGVAHEIRNPLTGVRGALELALAESPASEGSRALLQEAQAQLTRIEDATTQLLHYARPPVLRRILVDATLLVERAATIVEPKASSAGVVLRAETAPAPIPVWVDPELLVQVLVNLMLNGVQAMPRGGRLAVWVAEHPPEVWIGVRDSGPGVPWDERANVFRPFFTTKSQGTGLGLSISQQIVQRHGGTIRLADTPGGEGAEGGATFIVALPRPEEGAGDGHGS